MVNGTKSLLNLALALQALTLTTESIKVAKKEKKKVKDIVGLGTKIIIGTSLLGAQAKLIGKL